MSCARKKPVRSVAHRVVRWMGLLPILAGIGVMGYQILEWLRYSDWTACPLRLLAFRILPERLWVGMCGPWVGLHKVVFGLLEVIPLSLALIAAGICWLGATDS